MSLTPLLLVLASAFVHAAWDAILKRCREPEHAVMGGSLVSAPTANAISLGLAAGINVTAIDGERRRKAFAFVREAPSAIGLAGFLGAKGVLMFLAALASVGAGVS